MENGGMTARSRRLKQGQEGRGPVIYWMSRDQRLADNWALLFAQQEALKRKRPLAVVFCLVADYPGANLRHYLFLLRGLRELQANAESMNIAFHLLAGQPQDRLPSFVNGCDAALLVTDFDPLAIKVAWKKAIAAAVSIPFHEVDAHNLIPVWLASDKREYAAHTLRPKIHRRLDVFLQEFPELVRQSHGEEQGSPPLDITALAASVRDRTVDEVKWLAPGEEAGRAALQAFIADRLKRYHTDRNNPCLAGQSGLSPYFHFGQLAPQRAALEVVRSTAPRQARDAFLEELIVRRELADNFCHYTPDYDRFDAFPPWARKTLNEHRDDRRRYLYTRDAFEQGRTHEPLWNACQLDLVGRGALHGYLRMYWAKKILEWSGSPEEALETAIHLNDRFALDGRDPNGYTGIAWSIGGVHDRAWPERPVFGKIRYMNERGCRRKFDVDAYVEGVLR